MIVDLADKLIDRAIQLASYKKKKRQELIETYLTPVFEEFEQIHSSYLQSFARYRGLIQNGQDSNWIQSLQTILEQDNLFSANCRSKLVRLATTVDENDRLGPFIQGICEYLMGARLVDALGKEIQPYRVQRWRQSLFRTLSEIDEENWQLVIDPNGAMPPLSQEEIEDELKEMRSKHPITAETVGGRDALKRACALWALDEIVMEMQYQYDQVCQAYFEVKRAL